jgi:hypothetical protein
MMPALFLVIKYALTKSVINNKNPTKICPQIQSFSASQSHQFGERLQHIISASFSDKVAAGEPLIFLLLLLFLEGSCVNNTGENSRSWSNLA